MSKSTTKSEKSMSSEEVIAGLQALRGEQRQLANKITELEMELSEHRVVVETLRGVEGGRRCFRLVGGVLAERTAADVLPDLQTTCDRLPAAVARLHDLLLAKGLEIQEYVKQHGVVVQRDDAPPAAPAAAPDAKPNVLITSA